MILSFYDPIPIGNEYASRMFLEPLRAYASTVDIGIEEVSDMATVRNSTVVLLTDHLTEGRIYMLKENGNKIVGINVTDSSYISQGIRYATSLPLMDLIFMVSGVQRENMDYDFRVTEDFEVETFEKPFLEHEAWITFRSMANSGRLQSLPYVPWTPIPLGRNEPWAKRSQKTILRGGGHSRRFLLALMLGRIDKLDPNSGFVLGPYFADDMNPAFRYCDSCLADFKKHHHARRLPPAAECNSPAFVRHDEEMGYLMENLGHWNNRCPRSFYWMAEQVNKRYGGVDMAIVEKMLNARWLHPNEHMAMLRRILFTSDVKWMHSIYQPQRYWEAAAAGCVNILPDRVRSQSYFPDTKPGEHYLVFEEPFKNLPLAFSLDEGPYREISEANQDLFEQWIQPTEFKTNTRLLAYMIDLIRNT